MPAVCSIVQLLIEINRNRQTDRQKDKQAGRQTAAVKAQTIFELALDPIFTLLPIVIHHLIVLLHHISEPAG